MPARYLCFANDLYYPHGGALDYVTEVATREDALAWCVGMVRRTMDRVEGPCECSVLVLNDDGTVERLQFVAQYDQDDPQPDELVEADAPEIR